jgi:hypothetical protein
MTDNIKNVNKKRTTALAVIAGVALVLATAGCNSAKHEQELSHGEQFVADGTPRSVDKFTNTQIASGARSDATLNACHFDGNQLNSLGREKLRAMMKDDDACEPLTVYVNLTGTGDGAKARHESVTAFLLDEGLLESQVQLKDGANPMSTTPAVKALRALAASEGTDVGAAAPATAAPGVPTSATATK